MCLELHSSLLYIKRYKLKFSQSSWGGKWEVIDIDQFHSLISAALQSWMFLSPRGCWVSTCQISVLLRNIVREQNGSPGGIRARPLQSATLSDIIWTAPHLWTHYPKWLGDTDSSKGTWTHHARIKTTVLRYLNPSYMQLCPRPYNLPPELVLRPQQLFQIAAPCLLFNRP